MSTKEKRRAARLYRAAKTCLDELYERVPPGGVFLFDQYFDIGGGVRNAVDTFLRRHGELLFGFWESLYAKLGT